MIPITRPELPPLDEYVTLLEEIWSSRMLSNFGPMAQRLEAMTSEYLGVPTMVVVSGDIGLTLTLAALDLPKGSVCLVPSFTFNSTINAVLWNGLRPVFVDIDPEGFTMDPEDARRAAAGRDVSCIVATHVFGNPADADGLRTVADKLGARLLFDAAHGYGSIRDGVKVGGLGDAEVFSLSGTKPVTTAEGGLIATKDEALLERIRLLRGYGFYGDYNSKLVGLNGKMSEFHAALGLLTMRRIEAALMARSTIVSLYTHRLATIPGVKFQRIRSVDRSTYKDFAILLPSAEHRAAVEAVLTREGVQTKQYFRPCHEMDAFHAMNERRLAVTDDVSSRILCIPLFEHLSIDDATMIADLVIEGVA